MTLVKRTLHPHFHPVIQLPDEYAVFDLQKDAASQGVENHLFGVGRYDEKRENMYNTGLFEGVRNIHMGVDLFAPFKTPVFSFSDGEIFLFGNNEQAGDYGPTVVTKHQFDDLILYALFGHLTDQSLKGKTPGQKIRAGEMIGSVGSQEENGGWIPHLHFQLSYEKPQHPDMPGVVAQKDYPISRLKYPDPRLVLGALY
jgi:peptidoglycan LD-endopeptidase LytH